METITSTLTSGFKAVFAELGYETALAQVVYSNRPDLCQFQVNGALALAKKVKRPPRDIAAEIISRLAPKDIYKEIKVEGPGFMNITLNDTFISRLLNTSFADYAGIIRPVAQTGEKIIIDFCGPNVAKPMHVGHLRSTIIGDCLQRLYKHLGFTVLSDIHLGDWGTQMGMLICEMKRIKPELPYFNNGRKDFPAQAPVNLKDLEKMYVSAAGRCQEDEAEMKAALAATALLQQRAAGYYALWQHFVNLTVTEIKKDLKELKVEIDLWNGESSYSEIIAKVIKLAADRNISRRSAGALIIDVADVLKDSPPVMLLKSDGSVLYHTTDLAALYERLEKLKADKVLYVVDLRQGLHFQQVFAAAQKLGFYKEGAAAHIGFGTVNGKDGKPFKTRAGGVMPLKELITMVREKALEQMSKIEIAKEINHREREQIAAKVGLATLKFADLINNRTSDYIFDLDRFSRFEGKTGPYVMYTAVRIKSILRKAAAEELRQGEILPASLPEERDLMLNILKLPDYFINAYETNCPHHLCEGVFSLAQSFNTFYRSCHILTEKDSARQASYLALIALCLKQLITVLGILGIEVPERM